MSNKLKRSIAQVLSKYIGPHGGFMTCTTMDRCAEEVFEVVKNHHNHPAPVTCGNGCDCLAQCGDTYAHAGLPKPPDTEKASPAPAVPESAKFIANAQALLDLDAEGALTPHGIGGHARNLLQTAIKLLAATPAPALAVPQGWRFKRNADDSIGIFAPPPKPGESQRTSHAVYPGQNRDLHELLGKLADQQAATPAPSPAQDPSRPQNCGTSFCSCIECVCEPAQEVGLTDDERQQVFRAAENRMVREINLSWRTAVVDEVIAALRAKGGK